VLNPDKEPINFWLSYAEGHLLRHDPEQFLIRGFPPANAMGVPQKEAYENHILAMKEKQWSVSFLLRRERQIQFNLWIKLGKGSVAILLHGE
jgi:hypothetical protein